MRIRRDGICSALRVGLVGGSCFAALVAAAGDGVDAGTSVKPSTTERWERSSGTQGMISLTQVYADDDEAPSTQGLRIGYGFFGAEKNDYPWGEFWVAFRDRDDYEISAVGLSAAPIGLYHRRVGLGPIFDLGALRRERTGDTAYALTVGAGIEGFIRLRKNWDVVSALQATYRTTSDIEYQARFGIRFHHRKLPSVRREY